MFFRFTILHILIFVGVIYALKSWIEIKSDVSNPIKNNKLVKKVSFLSGVIVMIGFVFRVLHWPYVNILLIIGFSGIILSNIIIFFVDDLEAVKESNPNILDDIEL
jgi:predicted transporter